MASNRKRKYTVVYNELEQDGELAPGKRVEFVEYVEATSVPRAISKFFSQTGRDKKDTLVFAVHSGHVSV